MFSETKVTEIYRIADDFAKKLLNFRENIWLNEYSMPRSFNTTLFPTPFYHNNILFFERSPPLMYVFQRRATGYI